MKTKTVLDNGITVVAETVPGFRSCSLGLCIQTGSRFENERQAGLSHFVEHMLFKGTARRDCMQVSQAMDSVGGQLDAFTEKENTCFYAKVVAEHFDLALDLLGDMLLHSKFAPDDIEREKGVIGEEINMCNDTPDDLVFELFNRSLWGEHPLALPILGNPDSVASFVRADFLDYLQNFYTAERLVVSVVGNIDYQRLLEEVSKWQLPRASSRLELNVGGVPQAHPGIALQYRDDAQAHICWGVSGLSALDKRRYAMCVLDCVLGGVMSSRLNLEIREKRGLAYTVNTFQNLYRDCGNFGMYAGTAPDNVPEVLRISRDIFADVRENGISAAELTLAQEFMKGTLALELESTSARMMRLAKCQCLDGRYVDQNEFNARTDAVTLDDVRLVAREVLAPEKFHLAVVGALQREILEDAVH